MATREYLESILRRAREYLPKAVYDELHRAAMPRAGGKASWRSPKITPLEKLGLDSLSMAGVRKADDDTLKAAWRQLSTWHKQAGRKKQDQSPFARVAGYVLQEMRSRGLPCEGPLAEAAMAKSTLADRIDDFPDLVALVNGYTFLAPHERGAYVGLSNIEVPGEDIWGHIATASDVIGLTMEGADSELQAKNVCPGGAVPLYDLALVRSAPEQAPLGAGFWEIVEKSDSTWKEKAPAIEAPPEWLQKAEQMHKGAMVAVPVPESVADELEALGVKVGDREGLHITLAYFGKAGDSSDETRREVEAAVEEVAQRNGPLGIKVAGFGHFATGKDGTPVYAVASGRGLSRLQAEIEEAVGEVVELPSEHGWVPHITLGYIPAGDDLPDLPTLDPDAAPVFEVDEVIVAWASTSKDFPLEGPRDVSKALCPILCAQEEEQVIWYRVAVPGEKDTYGHEITKDEIRKQCHRAMAQGVGVKLNHGRDISDQAVVVENFLLPCDIQVGGTYHGRKITKEDGNMVQGEYHAAIYYREKKMWQERRDSDEGVSWGGYARKVTR